MSLILKNAVKQVDEKSKSYFVDKLKEYDYLIDEKEKKLSELESELEKRKNGLKDGNSDINNPNYDFDSSIIDMLTETNYLDKNIFELNKKIEEKFIINYEDLLKDFLSTSFTAFLSIKLINTTSSIITAKEIINKVILSH